MPKVIPSDFKRLPTKQRVGILKEILSERILSKAGSKDAVNTVKRMFNMPKYGITPSVLKRGMASLGVNLPDSDVQALFASLDSDRTGCILVADLLLRIQPSEFSAVSWNVKREREDEERVRKARGAYRPVTGSLPSSLKDVRWSADKIIRKLRERVEQRAKCPGLSQNREAYAMFGAPSKGISPAAFKTTMNRMGFVLDDAQLAEVFSRLDTDGSGVLTFADFVKGVLSDEYSGATWDAMRKKEISATLRQNRKEERAVRELPRSMEPTRSEMGLAWVEKQLRDKVQSKSRSIGANRELFRLFDHSGSTIDRPTFLASCRRLGIAGSDSDLKRLFKKYDKDGAGLLDFAEFSKMVNPPDYESKPWQVRRDEEDEARLLEKKRIGYEPAMKGLPRTLGSVTMSVSEVEDAIVERLNQRVKEPASQYREAYRLFGNPEDGITFEMLKDRLFHFGLVMNPSDLRAMFNRYDKDGSGRISFQELANGLFRKGDGSGVWNMGRDAEIAKRKRMTRELAMKDAPHAQRNFADPGGSLPFSSRSDLTVSTREAPESGRSWGTRSTAPSTNRFTGRSGSSIRSTASSVHRSMTSSRSHTAVRTGPLASVGIVGASAYSSRSSGGTSLRSSARSLLSR